MDWQLNIFDNDNNVRKESLDLVVETVSNLVFTFKGLENYCKNSVNVKIEWFENFKELPEEMRIKIYKHNFSEKRNNQLKEMVKLARVFMNSILDDLGEYTLQFQELKKAI